MLQVDALRHRFLTERLQRHGLRLLTSEFHTNGPALRILATSWVGRKQLRQTIGWYFTDSGTHYVSCLVPFGSYRAVANDFTTALDTFYFDPKLAYRAGAGGGEQTARGSGTRVVKVRMDWIFGLVAVLGFCLRRWFTRVNNR